MVLALGMVLFSSVPGLAQRTSDPAAPIHSLEAVLAGPGGRAPGAGRLRAAIERSFDTHHIARSVLAGDAPNAGQAERFRRALVGRITQDLLRRRRADRRGTLTVLRSRPLGPGEWVVASRLAIPGESVRAISWRVRAVPGGFRIQDVIGGGTSMVRSLRNEYAGALRRIGLDQVIARMEARNSG